MWKTAFSESASYPLEAGERSVFYPPPKFESLEALKTFLDWVHIKYCLLKPYCEVENYPLVEARELLPSFEVDLYEYKELPGFTLVAFDRRLNSFQEIFQFDVLHPLIDWRQDDISPHACLLENSVLENNLQTMRCRLPRVLQEPYLKQFQSTDICGLENYPQLTPFLVSLERAHVLARDSAGDFALQGIYGSLPSDLDTELKRYGIRIGKFRPGDNLRYECNRLFVYQFLMELHGFPIVSERRTSAALFARRLVKMGENFLVRVLGQSDRTLTTLSSLNPRGERRAHPQVEKIALVQVDKEKKETCELLRDLGYFVDPKRRVIILRVVYKQHEYNPRNVQEDRALSIVRQEIIHPLSGRIMDKLNIISDAGSMILSLNDIVRGEHQGTIVFKRHEVVQDTDTHEKRLKFLYSWLAKHQRRIIAYSDDFYAKVVQVLDSYLLAPENYEIFNELNSLHQEVWARYSYIQQARKIKTLEDLKMRLFRGSKVGYLEMLTLMVDILNDLKFEIVNYFEKLVFNVLSIGDDVLSDPYLVRNYVNKKDDELTEYGRQIKKLYGRLVAVLDEFRSIRRSRREDVDDYAIQNLL